MTATAAMLGAALAVVAAWFQPRHEAAVELVRLSNLNGVDPFLAIAVVKNESDWHPGVIGSAGEVGLGQVKPRDAAQARALLDWRTNLAATTGAFRRWREFCQRQVGTGLAIYWLQGYQGFDASRNARCGHRRVSGRWVALKVPALTRKVLARRAALARRFG